MEVKLAAGEPFDNKHKSVTCWTAQAGWLRRIDACRHAEQRAAAFERSTSSAVGEEPEVANAHQSVRQNMKQETAQELMSGNSHDLLLTAVSIVSPAERDSLVLEGHEAMVGDGHAMGIAGQVVEHMVGAAKGWLGVDHPVLTEQLPEEVGEAAGSGQMLL